MQKEAQAAVDKAEAWRKAAAASVEVAEARDRAQQPPSRVSTRTAGLKQRGASTDQLVREQQLRKMKVLVSRKSLFTQRGVLDGSSRFTNIVQV